MGYESQKTRFITYKNGTSAIGFYITASAYAFIKYQDGSLKEDKISLNAHRMNLKDDIEWYEKVLDGDEEDFQKIGDGETLEITQPGEYKATCGDYEDFVTILEVQDGSSAISITLSNPSMVFSNISAGESQECEVIVLEGAEPLNYSKTEFDNLGKSEFTIEITDEDKPEPEQIEGESGRTRCIITILDSVASGSKKLIVKGKNSAGVNFSQILTIYWTVASGGLVLSLDNDSDVFVTNADGTSFSSPIEITPILTRDGVKEDVEFSLISFPDSFEDGDSINGSYASFDKKKLTISKIPGGFEHGIFTFEWGNLRTSFTLRAVQSNIDYNLWIDKTVINNTNTDENSGDKIKVRVQKIDADGTASFLTEDSFSKEEEIEEGKFFIAVEGGDGSNTWNRDDMGDYYSIGYSAGSGQGPIHIVLKGKSEVEGNPFTWDEETIDFVQNGQTIQDFYITPTSYVFVKAASEQNSINHVQISAHAKNLGDGQVYWYRKNSESPDGYDSLKYIGNSIIVYREGEDNTIVGTGTYLAKFDNGDKWTDEVTIGEVLDGESAINVVLTNPSMTFNSNNTEEEEECQVIIYKGLDIVEATYYEITSEEQDSSFSIANNEFNNKVITISHQTAKGSKTFTIKRSTEENNPLPENFSQNITIYWTVVDDGRYSNVVAEPNQLMVDSPKEVKVFLYERVGGQDQTQIDISKDELYECQYLYYKKDGTPFDQIDNLATKDTDNNCFVVSSHEGYKAPTSLQITVYKDGLVWGKTTINILEAVSRRDHTIYHDAYSEASSEYVKSQFNSKTKLPILPDEKDYTKFPTHENKDDDVNYGSCRGWYTDQKEYIEDENGNITGSVYLASKQNSYSDEEQWDKPWYGPREIKQTPLTYDYWYDKLEEEMGKNQNKNKGIYPLGDGVLGINASLIRTGALRIYPFKPDDPSEETPTPVFETGWEAIYDEKGNLTGYNTEKPYVKIGGVDFTGLVPASTKQLGGPNLLISDENGIHLYGSNSVTWATNKKYEGYKVTLTGPYKEPESVWSQEVFYRFTNPNESFQKLYSLKAGQTYTLTGKAKISGGVEGEVLKFRSLVSDGSGWKDCEFFDIVTRTSNDSDEVNISVSFKVPENAEGFCFSFQLYNKDGPVKDTNYEGTIILEDLRLLEDTLDVSGGYSWKFDQQKGLMMWAGPQGDGNISDPNLMFKIYKDDSDVGNLWLRGNGEFTGKIIATSGKIGGTNGWEITEGGLSYENENDAKIIYLGPKALSGYFIEEAGKKKNVNVVFKIGEKFLVDSEGTLYAAGLEEYGKLSGGITTESITGSIADAAEAKGAAEKATEDAEWAAGIATEAKGDAQNALTVAAGTSVMVDNTYYGRNLLLGSEEEVTLAQGDDYTYNISTPLVAGKSYTFSFNVTFTGSSSDTLTLSFGENEKTWYSHGTGKHSVELQPTVTENNQSTPITSFKIFKGNSATIRFCEAKLELGESATEWSPAPEDDPLNVNSSNYSWLFSRTEGLMMWNGEQGTGETGFITTSDGRKYLDENLVFKIDKDQLYMRGTGVFDDATVLGNLTVGKVASKDDVSQVETDFFTGRNLLLGTQGTFEVTNSGIYPNLAKTTTTLKKDKEYIISGDVNIYNGTSALYIYVGSNGYTVRLTSGEKFQCVLIPPYDVKEIFISGGGSKFFLSNLKLELGDTATPWTMAPEEDPLNVNGIYSWSFSPSDGVSMSFLKDGVGDPISVFGVNNDGLFVKGKIEADSGSFGNLSIVGGQVVCNSESTNPTQSKTIFGTDGIEMQSAGSGDGTFTNLSHGSLKITTGKSEINKNTYTLLNDTQLIIQGPGIYYVNGEEKTGTYGLIVNKDGIIWEKPGQAGVTGGELYKLYYDSTKGLCLRRKINNVTETVSLDDLFWNTQ